MNPSYFISSILTIFLFANCSDRTPSADTIIKGGKIYTVNGSQSIVEAVGILNGKIVCVGTEKEVETWKGSHTQIIDLHGKTMTPGFIEGHGHFLELGLSELMLDLTNTQTYEELVEKVKEAVAHAKPGQWIIGRGWHQEKWNKKPAKMVNGFQTHALLSAISPNNPVYLSHASGHAGFANLNAMQLAGVTPLSATELEKKLNNGGKIIRDEHGNPTGIFSELALELITKVIPQQSDEYHTKALELAIKSCLKNGITSFHDADVSQHTIGLLKKLNREGKLHTRLYLMLSGFDSDLIHRYLKKGPEVDSLGNISIRSIKLHCDGALGNRGAWLLEPYSDRINSTGMATFPMDSVSMISQLALQKGFQVCSHAIGDRAIREVLDRYEAAFKAYPNEAKNARFRIEHAQHLHPSDLSRFEKLGVIASMQAIHLSSDRAWAIDRLGEKRIKEGAYMWQSLLKSGAIVINGSDAPIEPIDPIAGFYVSVTRKTLKGKPEGGYEPDQKMTRLQALQSYTINAAYAAFEDTQKGSIEVGKWADFSVFSQDLMTVPEDQILFTKVLMTILGGKILYVKE